MNVSELLQLTHWITREIVAKGIPERYQDLYGIMMQNASPNNQKQPFESQKEILLEKIKDVRLDQLTRDQISFLWSMDITCYIGDAGVERVEDILYKNLLDISTAGNRFYEIHQSLANAIAKSEQIKAGLTGLVSIEEYETNNEILMRVSFTGNASMSNVTDFKRWGGIWFDIGRGIAMAHDASPEDVKIVGASKGSIIIELAVIASIATTTSGIILAALKVAEKVIDIKIKAQELRAMKIKNDNIAKELENEAENEKKTGISEISFTFSESLGLKEDSQGDKVKALDTAIKHLVNFIENGGIVDFVIPESNEGSEDNDSNLDIRVAFAEIKRLEKKIALLECEN